MSLFDVLKYPISIPPTRDELRALPTDLFLKWMGESEWKNVDSIKCYNKSSEEWYPQTIIANYYGRLYRDCESDSWEVQHLKDVILGWGTDESL